MRKIHFSIDINASRARIWDILWSAETYPLWTSVFTEGSSVETDWQEGSKVLFHDGKGNGMSSRIDRLIPGSHLAFQHLGIVKDGVEESNTVWSGAMETYTLQEKGYGTELSVSVDIEDAYESYFNDTFPLALKKVKAIAETQKITTFLTFDNQAEAAMQQYVSIFKNARILHEQRMGDRFFSGSFEIDGQKFMVLNGGSHFSFASGNSLFVHCETQEEVDRLWEQLSEGGEQQPCGWLRDRFGVSWQIIPAALGAYLSDPDPAKVQSVMRAMLGMHKIEIAVLKAAYEGNSN